MVLKILHPPGGCGGLMLIKHSCSIKLVELQDILVKVLFMSGHFFSPFVLTERR